MCFRPASTTMGARICMSCHYVCDDEGADVCPQCGARFDAPAEPPSAPGASSAPGVPTAPNPPSPPRAPGV